MDILFTTIGSFLLLFVSLYKWIVIVASLITWVTPDQGNPIVKILNQLTQPVFDKVRKTIPSVFGGMDLSPLYIIFCLIFIENFLVKLMH